MPKTTKIARKKAAAARQGTKSDKIVGLLNRPNGASSGQLMKATGWQVHSVLGFLAGSLKKRGHAVSGSLDDGGSRRYRLDVVEA